MRIKLVLRKIIVGLTLLVGVGGLPGLAAAEEVESWVVRSEYQSPIPGREKSTIWWRFERQILAQGEALVAVTDLNQRVKTRAEFYYNRQDALSQADCYRQRRGAEICDARLYDVGAPVLINQSLIPGDWLNRELPFAERGKNSEYLVKNKVGVTGFSSHLLVTEREMGPAEARSSGMITGDNEALVRDRRLRLVTVNKSMGSAQEWGLLMRQLWAVGDNFWLYEEKAGRRSWRCERQ